MLCFATPSNAAFLLLHGQHVLPLTNTLTCGAEPNGQLSGIILKVVENKPGIHHLLVCTLCSCYPISVLGMAPSWYTFPLSLPSQLFCVLYAALWALPSVPPS